MATPQRGGRSPGPQTPGFQFPVFGPAVHPAPPAPQPERRTYRRRPNVSNKNNNNTVKKLETVRKSPPRAPAVVVAPPPPPPAAVSNTVKKLEKLEKKYKNLKANRNTTRAELTKIRQEFSNAQTKLLTMLVARNPVGSARGFRRGLGFNRYYGNAYHGNYNNVYSFTPRGRRRSLGHLPPYAHRIPPHLLRPLPRLPYNVGALRAIYGQPSRPRVVRVRR